MSRGVFLAFACLLVVGAAPGAVSAQPAPAAYATYRQALADHGLSPLVPASSAFAPGYIYKLTKDANNRLFIQTVCAQAFLARPLVSGIALPRTQKATDLSLSLGLKFLPPVLASKINAALGGTVTQVRSIDLSLEGLRVQEVPEANTLNAAGAVVKRKINPACGANLEGLATRDGKFVDATFMVIRATDAAAFSYNLKETTGGKVDLKGNFETALSGEAGWRFNRNNGQTFVATRAPGAAPIYIAADIVRLENAARVGNIGAAYNANLEVGKASDADLSPLADTAEP